MFALLKWGRMRDKMIWIGMLLEMLGAICIGIGLWLWSPALSLVWIGAIFIIFAWSMSGKETTNGNSDTEST
jgi:uncharacterized membrane protein YphA (DoxX/SURF4 family)